MDSQAGLFYINRKIRSRIKGFREVSLLANTAHSSDQAHKSQVVKSFWFFMPSRF